MNVLSGPLCTARLLIVREGLIYLGRVKNEAGEVLRYCLPDLVIRPNESSFTAIPSYCVDKLGLQVTEVEYLGGTNNSSSPVEEEKVVYYFEVPFLKSEEVIPSLEEEGIEYTWTGINTAICAIEGHYKTYSSLDQHHDILRAIGKLRTVSVPAHLA